jgi:hypothetical protein
MADDKHSESEQPSRDVLAAGIRCYRYKTWGSQPTVDGRWECYFDIVATRGGSRLRTYGATEIEAMERMLEVLEKEHIEKA